MASRLKLVRTAVVVFLAGSLAAAGSYRQTDVEAEEDALRAGVAWADVDPPTDYSGSRDRIEFEMASMQLFGPARGTSDNGAEESELPEAMYLIAIAQIDNAMYALIEEPGAQIQRLRQGQRTVSGWSVESIEKSSVNLSQDERRLVLKLFTPRTKAPAPEQQTRKRGGRQK